MIPSRENLEEWSKLFGKILNTLCLSLRATTGNSSLFPLGNNSFSSVVTLKILGKVTMLLGNHGRDRIKSLLDISHSTILFSQLTRTIYQVLE